MSSSFTVLSESIIFSGRKYEIQELIVLMVLITASDWYKLGFDGGERQKQKLLFSINFDCQKCRKSPVGI